MDARFQNPLGPKKEIQSGTWKYQVLYPDNLGDFQNIDQPSLWLRTDEDYRRMIQHIRDANKQAFHIVLMQVSLRPIASMLSASLTCISGTCATRASD